MQKSANIYWIVEQKRKWSEPLSPKDAACGFLGWHTRGYLAHFDAPGVTQFVTFRLADAMPAARRSQWEWMLQLEDELEKWRRIEAYLDHGLGECHLRRPDIADLVETALLHFDGERYQMHAWVVMPNHVHALFTQFEPLGPILESWKRFTSVRANRLLGRSGSFWQVDYFDRFMRDEDHFYRSRRYIQNNPTKARLAKAPEDWPWSSARRHQPAV